MIISKLRTLYILFAEVINFIVNGRCSSAINVVKKHLNDVCLDATQRDWITIAATFAAFLQDFRVCTNYDSRLYAYEKFSVQLQIQYPNIHS